MSTFRSSGDLAADRRYLWAEACEKDGDLAAAADLYGQAVEAAPGWAAGWFALGRMLAKTGRMAEAEEAFGRCLALEPADVLGAGVHLARLRGATGEMPASYIAGLFDQYAERFDTHLVHTLNYRGPQVLMAALAALRPPPYGAALDLGCGTGLMGEALAGQVAGLDGIDLSPAMLREADKRRLYRRLIAGDVTEETRRLADEGAMYDLILAADVLVYIGDLAPVFAAAHAALAPGGLVAFTVQAGEGEGYRLGDDLRFHHAEAYLRAATAAAHLTLLRLESISTRQDLAKDVPGFAAVLGRDVR